MADSVTFKTPPTTSKAPEAAKPASEALGIPEKPAAAPTSEKPATEAATDATSAQVQKAAELLSESEINAASEEFAKSGVISDKTLESFEKKGIPRALVMRYAEGARAVSEQVVQSIYAEVGGQTNYQAMQNWAAQALSDADKAAFASVIEKGDVSAVKLAVKGLNARYAAEHGQAPTLQGGSRGPSGPQPFGSREQMVKAVSDPRYQSDPAYRKEIQARIGATE